MSATPLLKPVDLTALQIGLRSDIEPANDATAAADQVQKIGMSYKIDLTFYRRGDPKGVLR